MSLHKELNKIDKQVEDSAIITFHLCQITIPIVYTTHVIVGARWSIMIFVQLSFIEWGHKMMIGDLRVG